MQSNTDTNLARFGPLRIGDTIRVEYSGAPVQMNSLTTEINGDGNIHLEYIGDVQADGKTPGELEKIIQAKYVPAYFTHLNVTVTAMIRYFYVDGEINGGGAGGRYPYTGQITLTRAIASAGGFTPFANRRNVRIYRSNGTYKVVNWYKAQDDSKLDLPIYPDDRIVVKRRLW
jgi:protein involved in polysaccharide export with SLBB domain